MVDSVTLSQCATGPGKYRTFEMRLPVKVCFSGTHCCSWEPWPGARTLAQQCVSVNKTEEMLTNVRGLFWFNILWWGSLLPIPRNIALPIAHPAGLKLVSPFLFSQPVAVGRPLAAAPLGALALLRTSSQSQCRSAAPINVTVVKVKKNSRCLPFQAAKKMYSTQSSGCTISEGKTLCLPIELLCAR